MVKTKNTAVGELTHQTKNKSEFIRSLPLDMHAADVVAAGKKLGMEFSEKYVYVIRSKAKHSGVDSTPATQSNSTYRSSRRENNGAIVVNTTIEKQLVELALEIGINRAQEIIENVLERIRGIALGQH